MSFFDRLVSQTLSNHGELAPLRPVVEKELLHHDILREMGTTGLLGGLTFIGAACLRACYGSNRLSEDLDLTGGANFTRDTLIDLDGVHVDVVVQAAAQAPATVAKMAHSLGTPEITNLN